MGLICGSLLKKGKYCGLLLKMSGRVTIASKCNEFKK